MEIPMNEMIKLPFVARAAAIAVAMILPMSASALAMPPALSTGKAKISYSDLDLATARGQVRLQNRVESAIRGMCGAPVFGTADEAESLRQCRADARADAQPKLRAILASAATQLVATR
jgi:UrcA family protein